MIKHLVGATENLSMNNYICIMYTLVSLYIYIYMYYVS